MTHKEHAETVRPAVPCAAWHVNFGGGCLNCGYDPNKQDQPRSGEGARKGSRA